MSKRLNLVGKKFSRLLVLEFSHIKGSNRNRSYWKCLCDCGNTKIVRGSSLKEGSTKSCGCIVGQPLPFGEAAVNYVLLRYKQQAKIRKLRFQLTKKYFKTLILANCHYCANPPSNKTGQQYNGTIKYNGIDRKNNKLGYTYQNVVSCCKECNFMKKSMSYTEFLNKIFSIQRNLKDKYVSKN